MAEQWIVSSHDYRRHKSFDKALAEAKRLTAREGKSFHVYRVVNEALVPHVTKNGVLVPAEPAK